MRDFMDRTRVGGRFFKSLKQIVKPSEPNAASLREPSETPQQKPEKNRTYKTNLYQATRQRRHESPRFRSQRKGEIGEYKVEVQLEQLPPEFKPASNILIKTEQGFEQIDHLIVSPYGLYLIEVKNLSGLIVGEEKDPHWYQAITWRVKPFYNPLLENQTHIETLKARLNATDKLPFYSFVTFNRRCDLKVLSGAVFFDTDILQALLKRSQQRILSDAEVTDIIEQIAKINISDQGMRNEYAARLHKQKRVMRPKFGDIRCCRCEKPVSERTARYCLTHPAKFDWHIYCAKHQKEMLRPVTQGKPDEDVQQPRKE